MPLSGSYTRNGYAKHIILNKYNLAKFKKDIVLFSYRKIETEDNYQQIDEQFKNRHISVSLLQPKSCNLKV